MRLRCLWSKSSKASESCFDTYHHYQSMSVRGPTDQPGEHDPTCLIGSQTSAGPPSWCFAMTIDLDLIRLGFHNRGLVGYSTWPASYVPMMPGISVHDESIPT